jgi:hypothetical protein
MLQYMLSPDETSECERDQGADEQQDHALPMRQPFCEKRTRRTRTPLTSQPMQAATGNPIDYQYRTGNRALLKTGNGNICCDSLAGNGLTEKEIARRGGSHLPIGPKIKSG